MKVIMFTPGLKTSAIGRMARLVVRQLMSLGNVVSVVRSEDEQFLDREAHDFGVETVAWNEARIVEALIREADFIAYHIGDNYHYHRGCLEWLPYHPGVVCLHDFYVGNLFCGWAQYRRPEAELVLQRWYASDVAEAFFPASSYPTFIEETCVHSPMTEWLCSMATGVITHSSWGIARVMSSCSGPVHVVPLAYDTGAIAPARSDLAGEGALVVLTVGHVNKNKRVESIIRAIGGSPVLRERARYEVVGAIGEETAKRLSSLAEELQVVLNIHGAVDDEALDRSFAEADIVCCLRWPSLEAASASTIEALLHGKAVIVTRTGFYEELPDDCVVKVDPDDEVVSLQSALEHLYSDELMRRRMAERGRAWAKSTFSAAGYAQHIMDVGTAAAIAMPCIEAAKHFARLGASWGGVEAVRECTLEALTFLGETPEV